jgi:TRAP-type mannitol/chloroaromatic compound transport system substrate-binding protein
MLHNFINLDKWNALPPAYKSLMRTASSMANEWMQAKYDAANPAALKRLVAGGAQLRPFPQPVMDASLRAALDVYAEVSRTMPTSRRCGKRCSPSATTNIFGGRSPS